MVKRNKTKSVVGECDTFYANSHMPSEYLKSRNRCNDLSSTLVLDGELITFLT